MSPRSVLSGRTDQGARCYWLFGGKVLPWRWVNLHQKKLTLNNWRDNIRTIFKSCFHNSRFIFTLQLRKDKAFSRESCVQFDCFYTPFCHAEHFFCPRYCGGAEMSHRYNPSDCEGLRCGHPLWALPCWVLLSGGVIHRNWALWNRLLLSHKLHQSLRPSSTHHWVLWSKTGSSRFVIFLFGIKSLSKCQCIDRPKGVLFIKGLNLNMVYLFWLY